ncbi:MAG: hypothetical protein HYZ42_09970 [Bacteroidetes bacterium]|nr:hypothetical protein [Bacteroidota bacterium]
MKKLFFIVCLCFGSLALQSQNYFPLDKLHSKFFAYTNQSNIYVSKIIDTRVANGDTVFTLNTNVEYARGCDLGNRGLYKVNAENKFISKVVVKPNSMIEIYTRDNDVLSYSPYWPTNLVFSSELEKVNSGEKYDISLVTRNIELIKGQLDSVLVYQLFDSTSKLVSEFKVYKKHGIIQFPNVFKLNFVQMDFVIPTWKDIYPYHVGDELEYKIDQASSKYFPYIGVETYKVMRFNKILYDSVTDICRFYYNAKYWTYNHLNRGDTSTGNGDGMLEILNFTNPISQSVPDEVCFKDTLKGRMYFYQVGMFEQFQKLQVRYNFDGLLDGWQMDNWGFSTYCPNIPIDEQQYLYLMTVNRPNGDYQVEEKNFMIGIGKTSSHFLNAYISGNFHTYETLIYYKLGNEIKGSKYNGVDQTEIGNSHFSIYPNPTSGDIVIYNSVIGNLEIDIYSKR